MGSITAAKLIAIMVVASVIFGAGYGTAHRFAEVTIQEMEKKEALAVAAAEKSAREQQEAYDNVALVHARQETAAQAQIAADNQSRLEEVSKHVVVIKSAPPCAVSWGLVRVLDAAVHGVSADSLSLPAGKSDGSCTGIAPAVLAQSVVENYGLSRANAEQLNSLIGTIEDLRKATKR